MSEAEKKQGDPEQAGRLPVLYLIWKSAGWLLVGLLLALLNSLRWHSPDWLSGVAWLSYGRVEAAVSVALTYGFGLQLALGVGIWLFVRTGKTRLLAPQYALLGAVFWNLAILIAVIGILAGHGSTYRLFELPAYTVPVVLVAYLILGGLAVATFRQRQARETYVSQWFVLAALLWFPWIFVTAAFFLHWYPVRGVVEIVIAGWYATGLKTLVLGGVGLGALFYLIPLWLQRPLHSRPMAFFAFWLLYLFGNGAGILPGTTLPAWIPALSTAMGFFAGFAVLLVGINFWLTADRRWRELRQPGIRFATVALASFLAAGLLTTINSLSGISALTQFTLVLDGLNLLTMGGFFVMTMFASVYYLLPRVLNDRGLGDKSIAGHFWLAAVGLGYTVAVLLGGGLIQGTMMHDPQIPHNSITGFVVFFQRLETLGLLLVSGAAVWYLVNIARLGCSTYCCGTDAPAVRWAAWLSAESPSRLRAETPPWEAEPLVLTAGKPEEPAVEAGAEDESESEDRAAASPVTPPPEEVERPRPAVRKTVSAARKAPAAKKVAPKPIPARKKAPAAKKAVPKPAPARKKTVTPPSARKRTPAPAVKKVAAKTTPAAKKAVAAKKAPPRKKAPAAGRKQVRRTARRS